MNKERYLKYLTLVEESLDGVFSGLRDCPAVLKESMRYTVTAGGKRIRPFCFWVRSMPWGET